MQFILYTSVIYNKAIASNDTNLIDNGVIILFIMNIDEAVYKFLQNMFPSWVEEGGTAPQERATAAARYARQAAAFVAVIAVCALAALACAVLPFWCGAARTAASHHGNGASRPGLVQQGWRTCLTLPRLVAGRWCKLRPFAVPGELAVVCRRDDGATRPSLCRGPVWQGQRRRQPPSRRLERAGR